MSFPRALGSALSGTRRLVPLAVLGETVLAGGLGVFRLGAKSMWLDEALTVQMTQIRASTFQYRLVHSQAKMALYYALIRPWSAMLGTTEVAMRLPSVAAFVLTVPLMFLLGRRMFNTATGLVAGLLYALSPFALQYAQEARPYAIVAFLATASTYCLVAAIDSRRKLWWAAWAVLAAVFVYLHLVGAAIVAAQVLGAVLILRDRGSLLRLIASTATIAILLVPLALVVRNGAALSHLEWIPPTNLYDIYLTLQSLAGGNDVILGAVLLLALIGGVVSFRRRDRRTHAVFLATWWIAPLLLVLLLSLFQPTLIDRYLIGTVPAMILLVAAGVTALRPRPLAVGTAIAAVAISAWSVSAWYTGSPKDDWRDATTYVLSNARAGDAIFMESENNLWPFYYYARGNHSALSQLSLAFPATSWNWSADANAPVTTAGLESAAAAHPRVWVVVSRPRTDSPGLPAEEWLLAHDPAHTRQLWSGVEVFLLTTPSTG